VITGLAIGFPVKRDAQRVDFQRSEGAVPISDSFGLVFVHIPKNAGTSIEKTVGMRETGHRPWSVYARRFPQEWQRYRSFAIIRDPVDRFISCYKYARMERSYWHSSVPGEDSVYGKHPDYDVTARHGLEQFIIGIATRKLVMRHPCWLPQTHWVCANQQIMVDEIIRYDAPGRTGPRRSSSRPWNLWRSWRR